MALLQRLYNISKGVITLDGNNVVNLDVNWLQRQIGYVQQESSLFGLSVRDNLLYGVSHPEFLTQD